MNIHNERQYLTKFDESHNLFHLINNKRQKKEKKINWWVKIEPTENKNMSISLEEKEVCDRQPTLQHMSPTVRLFIISKQFINTSFYILRILIATKFKCCSCLWKVKDQWLNVKQSSYNDVTLLCWSAFVRRSAPWSPISFRQKLSVVSVCEKWKINDWTGNKVVRMMLLRFAREHLQDVLLLEYWFDFQKG